MQLCKDSIVAGDSVIAAFGRVPSFNVKYSHPSTSPLFSPIGPVSTPTKEGDLLLTAIFCTLLLFGLAGGVSVLHLVLDKRVAPQERHALERALGRSTQAISQSSLRNNIEEPPV